MSALGHVLAGDMLGTQGAELPEETQELGHLAGPLNSSPAQPPPPIPPLPEPPPPPTQGHRPNPGMPSPPFPPACGPPLSRVGFAILALKSNHLPTCRAATFVPVTSALAQVAAAGSQLASYLHLPATARSLGPSQRTHTIPTLTLAGSLSTASFCSEGQDHSPRRHGPRGFSHHLLLHYNLLQNLRLQTTVLLNVPVLWLRNLDRTLWNDSSALCGLFKDSAFGWAQLGEGGS